MDQHRFDFAAVLTGSARSRTYRLLAERWEGGTEGREQGNLGRLSDGGSTCHLSLVTCRSGAFLVLLLGNVVPADRDSEEARAR
jgi:hypothetical protein